MKDKKTDKSQWKPTKKDWILYFILSILSIGQIVLCFLFYNSAGLKLALYAGWILLAAGTVLFFSSSILHEKGEVPEGKSYCDTTVFVDSGIYGVVRHPVYLSFIFGVFALILIAQHWLSVVLGIPIIVSHYGFMRQEEHGNIEKFGDDYKHYMQKVPRMNLLLGVIRLIQRRKRIKKV